MLETKKIAMSEVLTAVLLRINILQEVTRSCYMNGA